MNRDSNESLMTLGEFFELDGDVMRCRWCGRGLIASRDGEELHHASGCKNSHKKNPWDELREAMGVQSEIKRI